MYSRGFIIVFTASLLAFPISGWSFSQKQTSLCRKDFLKFVTSASATAVIIQTLDPQPAISANLPASNGADLSKTGTVEKLVPIVSFRESLLDAKSMLNNDDSSSAAALSQNVLKQLATTLKTNISPEEKQFKKLFDEYSDPVSYKQKYLDQNAFLVYYTKGFDGPNRDSIESGEIPRQTLQYGARNECWTAFEELVTEVDFGMKDGSSSSRSDVLDPLNKALASVDAYLSIAPKDDVESAQSRLK